MEALSEDQDPEDVFDILVPIGEGAYGSVYKALDKRDGALVALKIMPIETESGSLEKEVAILKKCKSPHIVNFCGSFIKDENIWLAMEYCGAGAVTDIMKAMKQTFTENEICVVMRESLRGLMYLHSNKVIHRDIKAGNILLNRKGQCKLADFGVSKAFENTIGMAKTVIGSPYWMAPEVFTDGKYNIKCDIWSLGITAIEMATGRPPLSDKSPYQAIFFIPRSDPPNLPEDQDEWSEDFRDFIRNCLIKSPHHRPMAKQLLQHKWIRSAKGLRITQELVNKAQPLLDAMRKAKRLEEEEDEKEDDDDQQQQGGHGVYNDEHDDVNMSTMVNVYDDGTSIHYDNNTSIMTNGNEEGLNEKGPGFDPYEDSTMLMVGNDDNDNNGNNGNYNNYNDNDDDGQYNMDTMQYNDSTMLIVKNDDDNKEEEDDDYRGNAIYGSEEEEYADGTMLINNDLATSKINIRRIKYLESMFKNNKYIDELLPIPNDVTKDELFKLFTRIREISVVDKQNLENFYKTNIMIIDEKIKQFQI